MRIEKITRFNDWWTSGKVRDDLLESYRRPLFKTLLEFLDDRQILLITGLRRVGKTTLFYQLIQELLNRKITPYNILYFSFDEELGDIEDVLETYEEKVLKSGLEEQSRMYVFFDEIQKVKNWQNKLKIFYDLYPNLKLFISGSASISLQKQSTESLAGRIYDFILKPLNFFEFLELKGLKIDLKRLELFQDKVRPLLADYLRKGGFPELINEISDTKIKAYVRNSVIEKIIYKDLPTEFGLKDIELLYILIRMVAENPGMILNYDNLSKDLHKNKRTISKYIQYLEYAMILRIIYKYREGFLVSSRKLRKVYVANTAISFAFVENFYSKGFLEKIAENLTIIATEATNYYRNSYEIDAIIKIKNKILPIEVKYGQARPKGLLKFLNQFNIKKGILITKDLLKEEKFDEKIISFIPLWIFLLKVAKMEFSARNELNHDKMLIKKFMNEYGDEWRRLGED